MTIALKDVEAAAFWEMDVCLECESIVQADGHFCPNCGKSPTLSAETVARVFEVVEKGED